jgi:hypothetical protein
MASLQTEMASGFILGILSKDKKSLVEFISPNPIAFGQVQAVDLNVRNIDV